MDTRKGDNVPIVRIKGGAKKGAMNAPPFLFNKDGAKKAA